MLSRDLVIDACALINLINGKIAHECATAIEPNLSVTSSIRAECLVNSQTANDLQQLIDEEQIDFIDEVVTAEQVLAFMDEHRLGAGESEAILVCCELSKHFWSDDRRARERAIELLTSDCVVGTAGVLRDLVGARELSKDEATNAYQLMCELGGYLPKFPDSFFEGSELR